MRYKPRSCATFLVTTAFVLSASTQYSSAAGITWTALLDNCDRIYNGKIYTKREPLNIFSTISGGKEHVGSDGVRYFSIQNSDNKWNGMALVAAYGIDDCSEYSAAANAEQCYPVHPPSLNFIFAASSPFKVGAIRGGSWGAHIAEPLENNIYGMSWYEKFPSSLLQHIRDQLRSNNNLYELRCDWYMRAKAG